MLFAWCSWLHGVIVKHCVHKMAEPLPHKLTSDPTAVPRRRRFRALGQRLGAATEGGGLFIVERGMLFVDRRCAGIACILGVLGVASGLVPLFFGLAWNFGGVAVVLAVYARYRRQRGDLRLSHRLIQIGFVLGVSAVLLGFSDLALVLGP